MLLVIYEILQASSDMTANWLGLTSLSDWVGQAN